MKLILLFFILLPSSGFAQEAKTANETESNKSEDISRPNKNVPVEQSPTDQMITSRLTKIIQVTGWVENLNVSSEEGVVRLSGQVGKQSQKEWVEKLAHDTDGVVAVLDNLDIKTGSWFDFNPAKSETESLIKKGLRYTPYFATSLAVFLFFLFLASLVGKGARRTVKKRIQNPLLVEIIAKLMTLPVILLGLYLVLRTAGLTGVAFTLMGGTGVIGLVAGFAMKNILENYFSGVLLSLRHPYDIGDKVDINGKVGTVQQLTTRGTVLVDADGNHIIIPNSLVYTGMIINKTANPASRIKFLVNVAYQENLGEVRQRICEILSGHKEVLEKPEPLAVVETFGPSGVDIGVYFWINASKSSSLKVQSALMEQIKLTFERDGIDMPGIPKQVALTKDDFDTPNKNGAAVADAYNEKTSPEHTEVLQEAERGRQIDMGDRLM